MVLLLVKELKLLLQLQARGIIQVLFERCNGKKNGKEDKEGGYRYGARRLNQSLMKIRQHADSFMCIHTKRIEGNTGYKKRHPDNVSGKAVRGLR